MLNKISILKAISRKEALAQERSNVDSILAKHRHLTTEDQRAVDNYYDNLIYDIKNQMRASADSSNNFFYDRSDDF